MLKILTYPNSILDQVSNQVMFMDAETIALIRQMYQTMEGIGVGLAAPQVGKNLQLCLVRLDKDMANTKDKELEFVMINPKISFYSELQVKMIEGCLSFPKQFYEIQRPANIIVEYETIANFKDFIKNEKVKPVLKKKKLSATGWLARVIQHEVDHLNGKLFINLGGRKIKEEDIDENTIVD